MRKRVLFGAWFVCIGLSLLLFLMRTVRVESSGSKADDSDEQLVANFSPESAAVFHKRCGACHTYGKGVKVGPDLKGVTERRKRDWLRKFVYASSAMIKSGDSTATALFAEFKQQRMPDWTDLSDKQIDGILDYISIGGPDIKPLDEYDAVTATPADIETGRRLFNGETRLKYGAPACATCHAVRDDMRGGSLGPDLTGVYFRYQDKALTTFLRQPCLEWKTGAIAGEYLTPKESFSVKAFLRNIALQNRASVPSAEASGSRR